MLHEITVIQRPSVKEQETGTPERQLLPLTQVVAESERAAILRVGVENAEKLADAELSRVAVIVRPVG